MVRFRTRALPSLGALRADETTTPQHRGLIVGGLLAAGVGLLWLARDPFGAKRLGGARRRVRVFRGGKRGGTGPQGKKGRWYYEPVDYDGDVIWSSGYATKKAAAAAASSEDS